jgi:predicted HicB family RNase H-like nuclease
VNNSNTVAHEIPEATESKNTSLDVPRELWKRVKVAAAQADITMRQYVIDSLERSLDQKRTIKK